jgi:N utilization substance protein B
LAGVVVASSRREARERALGLAYECEQRGLDADKLLAGLDVRVDEYAEQLLRGVNEHRDEIDELLRRFSQHWSLERMPVIDRALLRLGTYELAFEPDTPTGVVINEAVDLAREYSTKDSGRFVNGLLSRIAEEVRRAEPSADAP